MANIVEIQNLIDGPRNLVVKVAAILDTSDLALTDLAVPSARSDIGPFAGMKASRFRIDKIEYDIEDTLAMNLFWVAGPNQLIWSLAGRGIIDAWPYGGLQNTAGGATGAIQFNTAGWAASGVLSANATFWLVKQ